MPLNIPHLKVLISSPSDLQHERALAKSVIDQLNRERSDVHLDAVMWEHDSYSQIGDHPQAILNSQLSIDNCDFFVGMLWARIGTPTENFSSGTIEEFSILRDRYKKEKNSVRIMFFFKNTAIPINEIKPDHIQQIHDFKNSLGSNGLYKEFNNDEEFQLKLRYSFVKHLEGFVESQASEKKN